MLKIETKNNTIEQARKLSICHRQIWVFSLAKIIRIEEEEL